MVSENKPYKSVRLSIAKKDIIEYYNSLNKRILKWSEIRNILSENRGYWRVATNTSTDKFISFLLNETKLKEVKLDFPYRKEKRYVWEKASFYEIILSLNPKSYFTHYSSMYLNGLTEQVPKTFYLNIEQKLKNLKNQGLSQKSIDFAFKNKTRVSSNIANYDDKKICILNGKFTNLLGVKEIIGVNGEKIRVTDVERTLIDVTVRPIYSGGVFEVLKAFKMAKENVSINKLTAYLKKLDYTYPYHQAIGFYLGKSGVYNKSQIELLKKFKFKYDFYLTHQLKDMDYSKEWKLYFPKEF